MDGLMTLDEMRRHEWLVSWSGGKDSTATILLMREHHIPIRRIVYVRMMWDDELPATLPVMTEFVDRAAETFRGWGYDTQIVRCRRTAVELMSYVFQRSKYPEKNGRMYGLMAFARRACPLTGEKMKTIRGLKEGDEYEMIGYASDEDKRIQRLGGLKQSIMVVLGVKEQDAFTVCKGAGLLSPLYELGIARDGCFFCPNASKANRLYMHKAFPELVHLIYKWAERTNATRGGYDVVDYPNKWLKDYYDTGGIVGNVKPWHQQTKLLI